MNGAHTGGCRCGAVAPVVIAIMLSACASGPPPVPYPAFIQSDELSNVFIAGLPGVYAKQLTGDPATRRTSNRIALPPQFQFSTGASPGKSTELFVLSGQLRLGDIVLGPGGYAYIPPGSFGMSLATANGAELLYFLNDANPASVIQTPLILSSDLVPWQDRSDEPGDFGLSVRELRADPGSGARTWLLKIEPVAAIGWQRTSTVIEGYLVQGSYTHSECIDGQAATGDYTKGGYFQRPAGALNGGPEAKSSDVSIWFLRTLAHGEVSVAERCAAAGD